MSWPAQIGSFVETIATTMMTISGIVASRVKRPRNEARDDLLMLLGSIYLLIAGAGAWSLDAVLARERSPLHPRAEWKPR